MHLYVKLLPVFTTFEQSRNRYFNFEAHRTICYLIILRTTLNIFEEFVHHNIL